MSESAEDSILIIGNGPSVLEAKLGKIIDQFPAVGRINNYATAGFEDFVGSKTDIWFNGANQNLKKRTDKPERIVVLIPPEILQDKGYSIHARIQKRLQVNPAQYELVPVEEMEQIEQECGAARPTTGTASILWALWNFSRVTIYGFDFFKTSKSHYNDSRFLKSLKDSGIIKKAHKHDMTTEEAYIHALVSKGKLQLLKK